VIEEVTTMRKAIFCLALLLAACNDTDGNEANASAAQSSADHVPEIISLELSPGSMAHLAGNGDVVISATTTFRDDGRDLRTLRARMPDGTTMEFDVSFNAATGTFTEHFVVSTSKVGEFWVQFWLVDEAGNWSSFHRTFYSIVPDLVDRDWTSRRNRLPAMSDVVWNGDVFVAVGRSGTILTSADGIDWVARESATDADLSAVAARKSDIIAVGDELALLSTDDGENWIALDGFAGTRLGAVAFSPSMIVISGFDSETLQTTILISEDRGASWQAADLAPGDGVGLADIIYRDGLFVAVTYSAVWGGPGSGSILASTDGRVWDEVYRNQDHRLNALVIAGSRLIASGQEGAAVSSFDGFNWTQLQTPVHGVDFHSASWNGSKLLLAGGYPCPPLSFDCQPPQTEVPFGLSTTDGGASWDFFNVDRHFRSLGLAFGNGRFVSVGTFGPATHYGEGAIYTAD
jgi:hypothetical protein